MTIDPKVGLQEYPLDRLYALRDSLEKHAKPDKWQAARLAAINAEIQARPRKRK